MIRRPRDRKTLARPDEATSRGVTICGTGVQAAAHARAIPRVRPIEDIRVAGRDRAKAETLAAEVGGRAVDSFEEAVRDADVVCATTHSPEPVVRREWLSSGAHVTSVGINPNGRELDEATVRDARVYVESRAAALAPFPTGSNDLAGMSPGELIELGELLGDSKLGRTSADELTLYKSVGVAVMDAAAAGLVLVAAKSRGVGQEIQLCRSTNRSRSTVRASSSTGSCATSSARRSGRSRSSPWTSTREPRYGSSEACVTRRRSSSRRTIRRDDS